jgi:hypothetical protein
MRRHGCVVYRFLLSSRATYRWNKDSDVYEYYCRFQHLMVMVASKPIYVVSPALLSEKGIGNVRTTNNELVYGTRESGLRPICHWL